MDPVITVTTQPIDDPHVPTPTHYDELSDDLLTALGSFISIVPKVDESLAADPKDVRRSLNVPILFCQTAITATEQLPELETLRKQYAEIDRNRLQFIAALTPVDHKLDEVSRRLKHVLRMARSMVGRHALEIYRIAKARMTCSNNPSLTAHVDTLQRILVKRTLTKEEREQQKVARLNEAVDREIELRAAKGLLTIHKQVDKEVIKLAA